MNYLTLVADGDGTIDETSWGVGGYGTTEAVFRILGKGMNKGGQTTLLYDINHRYPCGYIRRHKLQSHPQGFTAQGPAEMFALVQSIDKRLQSSKPTEQEQFVLPNPSGQGERVITLKSIYQQPPHHLVADNHLTGD
jgi:hypothetical protein